MHSTMGFTYLDIVSDRLMARAKHTRTQRTWKQRPETTREGAGTRPQLASPP